MPVLAPGQIQSIRLGGDFSYICWSSLITASLLLKEMKYTSQHFSDKIMDDKLLIHTSRCLLIVRLRCSMDGPLPSFRWDGNCGPVLHSGQRPEELCPEWSYLKQFREADAHIKKGQKEDFDRRHRARNLPPLQPETYAWLKYDSLTDTRVSAPAAAPRSYIAVGEGSRTIRRNCREMLLRFPLTTKQRSVKEMDMSLLLAMMVQYLHAMAGK